MCCLCFIKLLKSACSIKEKVAYFVGWLGWHLQITICIPDFVFWCSWFMVDSLNRIFFAACSAADTSICAPSEIRLRCTFTLYQSPCAQPLCAWTQPGGLCGPVKGCNRTGQLLNITVFFMLWVGVTNQKQWHSPLFVYQSEFAHTKHKEHSNLQLLIFKTFLSWSDLSSKCDRIIDPCLTPLFFSDLNSSTLPIDLSMYKLVPDFNAILHHEWLFSCPACLFCLLN